MKAIQKILFVMIVGIGLCRWNVNGVHAAPVLDFDTIAVQNADILGSFQPKWNDTALNPNPPAINAPNGQYIYFTVVPNGGGARNVNFAPLNIHGPGEVAQQAPVAGDINIYFPRDGHQPTTQEAAEYSCANVVDDHITDWYIRAFGGDDALEYSKDKIPTNADSSPKFGFKKLTSIVEVHSKSVKYPKGDRTLKAQTEAEHIITVNGDKDFKKSFWKNFRVIASNPVGRVLLYRLIIEIRRSFGEKFVYNCFTEYPSAVVEQFTGAIEGSEDIDIAFSLDSLWTRNNCRSITIKRADSNSFSLTEQCIEFSNSNDIKTSVLKIDGNSIRTEEADRTADIGLLHEMLHWFHYLRDYNRYDKDRRFDGSYCHLMMCYLGNNKLQEVFNTYNELFAWATIEYKDEELRTILGTPNYDDAEELGMFPNNVFVVNTSDISKYIEIGSTKKYINSSGRFLNGDDLSENAYRMSKHTTSSPVRMRFGHADDIKPVSIVNKNKNSFEVCGCLLHKYRFMLPNLVARHCYKNITGNDNGWSLETGEAAN